MFKIVVAVLTFAIGSGPAMAEKAKGGKAKTPTYEECQKRAKALGLKGRSPNKPDGNSFMAQCMRGEV